MKRVKHLFIGIKSLLTVYNKWTCEHRVSREMGKNVIVSIISIAVFAYGVKYGVTEAMITSFTTWALSGWDMYLRITSKGGESILKKEVREQKAIDDEMNNLNIWLEKENEQKKKSLMPDLPGD